ncbi:MAG: hypothetical protein GEU75_09845 [Dehalococcoidia bacterium]|nr:hypothetical protein [Dehalococcoidia bacterium]
MAEITIAELVRNGTMSAEMAAVLWAAVDEQLSFLTVAMPRNAGKSTTSEAVLALRPPGVTLHRVAGQAELMQRLQTERLGGYLVVAEFSPAPVPGYIWGPPVQRVFDTLSAGYSLQTCLHATSVEEGILEVTAGNGISDEQASAFKLVLYIEMFGRTWVGVQRRLVNIYEVHKIEGGRPVGHPLFVWRRDGDHFEQVSEPHQFGRDREDLTRRAEVIGELAREGRTSEDDVSRAVAAFRESKSVHRPA